VFIPSTSPIKHPVLYFPLCPASAGLFLSWEPATLYPTDRRNWPKEELVEIQPERIYRDQSQKPLTG
jgi:hypothetical protein